MPIKKILIALLILFALALTLFFTLRDGFLQIMVTRGINKAERVSGYKISIGNAGFEGLITIGMQDLAVLSQKGDTVMHCGNITIKPSIWRWALGRLPVKLVSMHGLHLNLDLLKMPETAEKKKSEVNEDKSSRIEQINRLIDRIASLEGLNVIITDGVIQQRYDDQTREQLVLKEFLFDKHRVNIHAQSVFHDTISDILVTGSFRPSSLNTEISGRLVNPSSNGLPFIKKLTGISLQADSFKLAVENTGNRGGHNHYRVDFFANHGKLSHVRIGPQPVSVDSLALQLNLRANPNETAVVSPSVMTINRLPLSFTFMAHQSDTTHYGFSLGFDSIPSSAFFESLPKGLFESLQGIKTEGNLSYHLAFSINPDKPEDLQFSSHMKGHKFRIRGYGEEDFSKMNRSFEHIVRENDRVVRSITVGPENPWFTPLDQVSPLLVNSILICEDGSFFTHRGFSEKAFRQSIITNIREKRFARGGSTISMQLVKNVYLSRNKTISRKVEEALIVWLIENNRLVSKERMMEVYLNIIEWGPGVYGVGEATDFYFTKKPAQLTLDESIYMASIIPRPKYFKFTFDSTGTLKNYLKPHFNLVTERLLKKEIITEQDTAAMNYHVVLKGRAAELVMPTDTLPADSLEVEIQEMMIE